MAILHRNWLSVSDHSKDKISEIIMNIQQKAYVSAEDTLTILDHIDYTFDHKKVRQLYNYKQILDIDPSLDLTDEIQNCIRSLLQIEAQTPNTVYTIAQRIFTFHAKVRFNQICDYKSVYKNLVLDIALMSNEDQLLIDDLIEMLKEDYAKINS